MPRPTGINGSISNIKVLSGQHEIIPHRLTDGAHTIGLPSEVQDGETLVVSQNPISIPAAPTSPGEYKLFFSVENGVVTPKWVYVDNTVHYFDAGSTSQVGVLVLYGDGRASGGLGVVYC